MAFFLGAATLMLVFAGIAILEGRTSGAIWKTNNVVGALMLTAGVTILTATVPRWASWTSPLFIFASVRIAVGVLTGHYWMSSRRLPLALSLPYLFLFLSLSGLTLRFIADRPTRVESLGLVAAVGCACLSVTNDSYYPLLVAVGGLCVLEIRRRVLRMRGARPAGASMKRAAESRKTL